MSHSSRVDSDLHDVVAEPFSAPNSLRIGLILFLVFVCLAGFGMAVIYKIGSAPRELAREIEQMGGAATIRGRSPQFLPAPIEIPILTELQTVVLDGCSVEDAWLAKIRSESGLRFVDLDGAPIKGDGLHHLANKPYLRTLGLEDTQVDDEGVLALRGLQQLRLLDLTRTHVTDASLAHLATMPELRLLGLDGTQVTDRGIAELVAAPQLTVLDLEDTSVTDGAVESLLQMSSLKELYVAGSQLTSAGVERLRSQRGELMVFTDYGQKTTHAGKLLLR